MADLLRLRVLEERTSSLLDLRCNERAALENQMQQMRPVVALDVSRSVPFSVSVAPTISVSIAPTVSVSIAPTVSVPFPFPFPFPVSVRIAATRGGT